VLPPENRLRRSADFRHALKAGRRCKARTLVVHLAEPRDRCQDVRIGFVVAKGVGGAVVRNRVRRRLRHAIRSELPHLAATGGLDIVVRATPPAADAAFGALRADLLRCLADVRGAG
jgi:ribonuclease P protein component